MIQLHEAIMSGQRYGSLLFGLSLLAVLALPSSSLAQGTTAFPMLSYQPIAGDSPLANPASFAELKDDGLLQDEEIRYKRHPLMGAVFGAIVGAAAGYVAGGDATDRTRGEQALIGAAVGAGIGLVVGYFIKTPVIEDSALGAATPEYFAVVPSSGGAAVQVGWSGSW